MDIDYLLERTMSVIDNSYSPYSKFQVASGVLASDGIVYTGVNVENVCYSLTMCAERSAIFNAIGSGAEDLLAIAVYHNGDKLAYPCGACLQVMSEFDENMTVIVFNDYEKHIYKLKELLPYSFRSDEV